MIEVIIATMITTVVGGSVAAIVQSFVSALAIQDQRSEAIVRTAGIQSHLGLLSLKTRMSLALAPQRVLLWLPAETLEQSGSGRDNAFDRIDIGGDELHWLEFVQEADSTWSLIEWTVKANMAVGETTVFTVDGEYWDSVFDKLQQDGALRRSPLAFGLAAPETATGSIRKPRFVWQTSDCCQNHSVGAEFGFIVSDAGEVLRSDVRIESALAFFDRHPICSGGGS